MTENPSWAAPPIQYIHEIAFSLNLAFVATAMLFLYAPYSIIRHLNGIEISINRSLHIRQNDLIRGYWEFFLTGIVLALCIWMFLRLSSNRRFAPAILRYVSGVVAVGAPPAYWLCATFSASGRGVWNPFHTVQLYEVVLILAWVLFYLQGKWLTSSWLNIFVLSLHFSFWLWQFWPFFVMALSGYGGSPGITVVAGFAAGLAWLGYMRGNNSRSNSYFKA